MSERISIKGKGDELFFDASATPAAGDTAQESSPAEKQAAARQTDNPLPRQTDSKPARTTERQTARLTDGPAAESWSTDTVGQLRQALLEDHPVHNTFRYPQATLDAVRDIVYELEVKRSIKTTRNDVMRLALAWIIDDYHAHGADSLLVAVLKEERWRPGR